MPLNDIAPIDVAPAVDPARFPADGSYAEQRLAEAAPAPLA